MEERELVLVPEETLHQLLVQGLGHEIIFASDHEYFVGVDSAVLNSIKVQGLPHKVIQFKPLKVIIRHYPFECWSDPDYYTHTPYRFVPKLFAGALGENMPQEIDELIKRRFMETEIGKRVIGMEDVAQFVFLKSPVEIELTGHETLYVIKHLLQALCSIKQRVRVSGFEELGLRELAKKYNSALKSLKNKK